MENAVAVEIQPQEENTPIFQVLQSEQINELVTALSKAQGEIENAAKDMENTFFKSTYASLAGVRDATKNALAKYALAVIQQPTIINGKVYLITTLAHASGQWMRSFLPIRPVKDDPQGLGGALTYMRRYGLGAITGVASEDDDDGNAASGNTTDKPARQVVKSATGISRTNSKSLNAWHNEQLAAINAAVTLEDLRSIYPAIVKQAQENGCTEDQIGLLTMQKDNRKEFLTNQEAK